MMEANKVNKLLESLCIRLNRVVENALAAMGVAMALIVCAQVFYRYALNNSLFWSEEVARYLLVWLTFLGASSAYHRGVHPRIDTFAAMLPEKVRRAVRIGIHFVSLILFIMMVVFGIQFSYFIRLQISPALSLPKWIVTSVIPLSGLILFIHNLRLIIEEFRRGDDDS